MGCDIHANLEHSFEGETKMFWGLARDLYIDRSYELFGYLAGVRNKLVEPISEPRGIPEKISAEVKEEYEEWIEDAHNESWLTFAEMEGLPDRYKEEPFYRTAAAYSEKYGKDNVRMVFWFDN